MTDVYCWDCMAEVEEADGHESHDTSPIPEDGDLTESVGSEFPYF